MRRAGLPFSRVLSAAVLILIASASAALAQGTTVLFIDSAPGDSIGQGRQYTFTPSDAPFTIQKVKNDDVMVSVRSADLSIVWRAWFVPPTGQRLQVGSYYAFGSVASPLAGLDISGEGRGCSAVGRFDVLEIVYAPDGTLASFAADFEQHCNAGDPALFGAVRYNSSVSSFVPFGGARGYRITLVPDGPGTISGPGLLCGSGSGSCTATFAVPVDVALVATPDSGYLFAGWNGTCTGDATTSVRVNTLATCIARFEPIDSATPRTVVMLDSMAGETVGGGKRRAYVPATAFVAATPFGQGHSLRLEVTARDSIWQDMVWTIDLVARGTEILQVREYPGARRFAGGVTPELSVRHNGALCNPIVGRFVVHEFQLANDFTIASLSADIEQHCGTNDAAMFVAVRYNVAGSALPFNGAYPRYGFTGAPPQHGTITGPGVTCGSGGSACGIVYGAPQSLDLQAVADPGYIFAGWDGDCRGGASTTLRVFGMRSCGAAFQPASPTLPRTLIRVEQEANAMSLPAAAATIVGTENTVLLTPGTALLAFTFVSAAPDGTVSTSRYSFSPPPGEAFQLGRTYLAFRTNALGSASMEVGTGCNSSIGRFVLKEFSLSAGVIQAFAVDFEEHCNGADPAVHGSIRYNSAVDATMFDGPYPVYAVAFARPENGNVSGGGLDCGTSNAICRIDVNAPQDVMITATPGQGFLFGGWTGTCHGGPTAIVRANMLRTCGVRFLPVVPAEPRTLLTVTGEAGHTIAPGRVEVFSNQNAVWRITGGVGGSGVEIQLDALGDRGPERWTFGFAAGSGVQLAPGRYIVTGPTFWTSPQMTVTQDLKLCRGEGSEFTVREVRADASGAFSRLWVDFVLRCTGGTSAVLTGSLKYNSILEMGALSIDRAALMFGASIAPGGAVLAQTPAQVVRLTNRHSGSVAWEATTTAPWLTVQPASGTGSATLSVSVLPSHSAEAVSAAQVLVKDGDGEAVGTVAVTMTRTPTSAAAAPFGSFDTPVESSTPLRGSVAVTGWAVDDVAVDEVQIWRDPHPSESVNIFNGPGPQRGKVFIGIATRVEGARPDIERLFAVPDSTAAGWGYLMLTRALIWDGQGPFRLYAIAVDREGHIVEIGRKTVTIENATATQPFGAIDSPAPGETVSGVYPVTGWVLTPNPGATIPAGGVQIVIDGVFLPHVLSTGARADITAFFSTFDASMAGRGAFVDTRTLSDGLHTISWLVTDSTGKVDAIGSRYFRVANGVVVGQAAKQN